MAFFPLGGCVISLRTIWDQRGSSGVHLCQKVPKSVKKWLSYSYFPTERLRDFIENHMGPEGILGYLFVPKRSKIGQEMAEVWLFSHWEAGWFHWEPNGTKRDPWVFICTKKIKNPSRNGKVMAISPERLCDSIEIHMGQKGILRCSSYSTKKIQDWSRNGWVMAIFPLRGWMIPLRTKLNKKRPLGVHLNKKDPKSVQKELSYGYFPTEMLCDSI